jgi:hypothetical protein
MHARSTQHVGQCERYIKVGGKVLHASFVETRASAARALPRKDLQHLLTSCERPLSADEPDVDQE